MQLRFVRKTITENIMVRMARVINKRFPHTIKVVRKVFSDNPFDDTEQEITIYEGEGRSYTNTTTDGDGKVVTNMRKASIPPIYNDWRAGLEILNGDLIEVTIGNITERGVVRDFEPCNFGTEIYWDYIRN